MIITSVEEWSSRCLKDPVWLASCLQRICRFGGQVPISVLSHSVVLAGMMQTPEQQLWALLHDAHEVLTGDCCRLYASEALSMQKYQLDLSLLGRLRNEHHIQITGFDAKEVNSADLRLGLHEFQNPGQFSANDFAFSQFLRQFDLLMTLLSKGSSC